MEIKGNNHGLFDGIRSGDGEFAELSSLPNVFADTASFWPVSLTQRQRVLLHIVPLQALRSGDASRDYGAHYDTLVLALKTFDVIIDHTGFGAQVNRNLLYQHLLPLLRAMDTAAAISPDANRHSDTVDRVIAALRNDPDRRRPFTVEYQDFNEAGQAIRRVLEFRLLTEEYGLDGSIVLVLTSEAINLYLRAFDLDIEDAQIANEAVVQSQIERGKFHEAIQSAQNARLQSIRYHDRVAKLLQQTRRDLDKVDWRQEMPALLAAALNHIDGRLNTERAILQSAEFRRDDLPLASEQLKALLEVIKLMRDCQKRHLALHRQLMRSRGDFLDQQVRQSFVTDGAPLPVDLLEHVLKPAMSLPREKADEFFTEAVSLFCGAQPRPAISVKDLIEWHLRPRRPLPTLEVPINSPDLVERGMDTPRFHATVMDQVDRRLLELDLPIRLSDLLRSMEEGAMPVESLELLSLRILQAFAPDQGEGGRLWVSPVFGEVLKVNGFYGDELMIQKGSNGHAR